MRAILLLFLLIALPLNVYSGEFTFNPSSKHPQNSDNAFSPGNYQIAIKVINPVIDPGELLTMEVYITGYGTIKGCKLSSYPSSDLFDSEHSEIIHGLKISGDNKIISFGSDRNTNGANGFVISFSGYTNGLWENNSTFFDVSDGNPPIIMTERRSMSAPVTLNLKSNSYIKPGNYNYSFNLTYYNGVEWKGDKHQIEFTVRNVLQRNEIFIATIGCIAAIATILPPTIQLGQWATNVRKRRKPKRAS